jgi:cytochrome c peroxidase
VKSSIPIAGTVLLLGAAAVTAQYGPGRIWWDAGRGGILTWDETYDNPDGQVGIVNAKGPVHAEGHPFFEALGTNGRACITCHQPSNAMSLSVATIRERWRESGGRDPLFAAVDGSNCPDAKQEAEASHSLVLGRGLFRIALPWPPKEAAQFHIEVVRDPTGCNTSPVYGIEGERHAVSVFRRPRVAANLAEATVLMADGRAASLEAQATEAALAHEQATAAPGPAELRRIAEFERQIFTAQNSDIRGGLLGDTDGPAALGPANLAAGKSAGLAGAAAAFAIWALPKTPGAGVQRDFRASVARGSELFFRRTFAGQTCATCHATDIVRWMDIGTANVTEREASPDLPLFRITCHDGRVVYTQDPGRGLITGRCADIGMIAIQQFRGLAARAPYFSNGSAATLRDVVEFYDRRFAIVLSEGEKNDLVNFLKVL